MNLILFEADEIDRPLPASDPRAQHILRVLHRKLGDTVDAGIVNGPRGKATVTGITATALTLAFAKTAEASPVAPITLIIGLPRPQTARDILRDATTAGVGALHFVRTEKGDRSYGQSTLWSGGEWKRHVRAGAEQAFDTRVPEVTFDRTLTDILPGLAPATRLALDNYESPLGLADVALPPDTHVTLAIGSERGWSEPERHALRQAGFQLVHLGPRVLRTESAVVAALTLVRAKLRLM